MYEAVRQRAPISSKAAGLVTTVLMTAAAGYVMANGFGAQIAIAIEKVTTIATLTPEEKKIEPDEILKPEIVVELPAPPVPPIPDEVYVFDKPPPITIPDKPAVETKIGPGPIAPAHTPVRVGAKINAREKPDYPPASIRGNEQGVTGLDVCVDARGRVTSASLARTSGHERLDEAALRWVRGARFAPGTVDGVAQPMCGQRVTYEWTLNKS